MTIDDTARGITLGAGGGYSLIKTGLNQVSFVDVGNVDLGKVNVQQGVFQYEGNTRITNATMDVEIFGGATLGLWGSSQFHTKPITLQNNGRVFKDNGTTTNDGLITLSGGTAIIEVANNGGDTLVFRNAMSGPGGFAKVGAGNLFLPGTNTYFGSTVVSNGTLTIQTNASIANSALVDVKAGAVLNVSTLVNPLTIGSGKTLAGAGTIVGRVTADTGANVTPGTSPGTLNVSSNLVLNNANLTFELNTANTEGGGVNDLINARDLTLSGVNNVSIIPLTPLGAGPYTLLRYTNTLTGGAPQLSIGGGSRYTWTVDTTAPLIRITPAGAPASLVWGGGVTGSETLWDVNTTGSWTNGVVPDNFFQGDAVSFTDISTYTNISLVGSLSPGNITANHTFPITFGGAGQIKTLNQLSKLGTGALILGTDNPELNGGITIGAGVLQIGAGGTAGSVGPSAPITNNATLVLNRSDSNGLPNVIRGSGALVKNGAGIVGVGGANAFSGPVVVNAGKIRIANAGALGSSNNNVTVNNGGQIDFGGVAQAGVNQRYNYFIAGYGPDGRGAVVNNGNSVSTSSGLSNVTLTADAAIGTFGFDGDGGRIDIGSTYGELNGGGNRLVKLGPGRLSIRVTNTVNLAELAVSNGLVYAENANFTLGTNAVVYPGASLGMYAGAGQFRTNSTVVRLEGGSLTGGGQTVNVNSNVWTGPIFVNQPSVLHAGIINGNADHLLMHNLIGSSLLSVVGNSARRFELHTNNDATFSGPWSINSGGVIRTVSDGTLGTGAITNFGTIEWSSTNAYTFAQSLTAPFGFGTFRQMTNASSAGAVTFNGPVAQNFIGVQNGDNGRSMTFGSTATVQAGNLSVGITPAPGSGRVNISAGGKPERGQLLPWRPERDDRRGRTGRRHGHDYQPVPRRALAEHRQHLHARQRIDHQHPRPAGQSLRRGRAERRLLRRH